MAVATLWRLFAARRRHRSLALAVRLFECAGDSEPARVVLTLGAAALFDRYLAGRMELGEASPARPEPSEIPREKPEERIVPFPRPVEGA